MAYQVLLFYKYVTIEDPKKLKWDYEGLCQKYSLTGRTIIASEGINGTLEGTIKNTELFIKEFKNDPHFSDLSIKKSKGSGTTFPKLSVKIREEIVGTGFGGDIDPTKKTGTKLSREELHDWYEKGKDFVVIDMRNSYEYKSGHFKNSVDPGMLASRDLPKVVDKLKIHKDKTVVTVCTGEIRCEKMSAYLQKEGFSNVYKLENGIHSYMEKYPGEHFKGALYTFDGRVTMNFGGDREIIGKCGVCESQTEEYQNCANDECHLHFLVCRKCVDSSYESGEPIYCSEICKQNVIRITWRVRGNVPS